MPSVEERLEAIAHHLQLTAHLQQTSEQESAKIWAIVNILADSQVKTERAVAALVRVAADHEHRIDELGG